MALLSFFTWLVGPHPTLKKAGWILLQIIICVAAGYYIHWLIPVIYVLFRVIGWLMFRGMFFEEDCVKFIRFYKNGPRTIDFGYIGKDTWEEIPKIGGDSPAHDSHGRNVFIIEDIDEKGIAKMAWIHEASLAEFIRSRTSFELVSEIAQVSSLQFMEVQDIPEVLGIIWAGEINDVTEEERAKEVLTLDPANKTAVAERLKRLKEMSNPITKATENVQKRVAERQAAEQKVRLEEAEPQEVEQSDQSPE